MSKVYFFKIKKQSPEILREAGKKISEVFSDFFGTEDKVAIKLHFGERKSKTHLNPVLVKAIYDRLVRKVKKVVLTDCNVLYKGERSLGSTHKKLAQDNGFDFAPILIADGEKGEDEMKIELGQKHFKEVKIGAGIKDFNSILAISHFTRHGGSAFGGALKNVGMGFGSKGGKLEMHQAFKLEINSEICVGCGICQRECPAGAIEILQGKAKIDFKKCIGCGRCIAVCPNGAVEIPWGASSSKDLQERIVEYAFGVLKGKKAFFVNVLLDITPSCDCINSIQKPMVPDIGILASEDIVAIDKASLDLVGKEKFEGPGVDPMIQINYAEELGLGKRDYQLIKI
jgi:hypothetical protein